MASQLKSVHRKNPALDEESFRTGPDDPASRLILACLARAVERIQAAGEAARGGEVEGVHRLRTSARRLRSELRAFGKLVADEPGDRLADELKWLGNAVADVRDLDVLRARFEKDESDEDRSALKPLFDRLAERHAKASRTMRSTLKSQRFQALSGLLRTALEAPPLANAAAKPCRKILPPLVAKAWKRLRKDGESLGSDSPDPAFHDLRKHAKRARYTTEAMSPALGPKAGKKGEKLVELARTIQDVLGEHQDAVVAMGEVEAMLAGPEVGEEFREAARRLLDRLRREADESRDAFLEKLRPKLEKKKNRGRLKADS